MLRRTLLPAGAISLSLLVVGCKTQSSAPSQPAARAVAPAHSPQTAQNNAAPQSPAEPAQPDDASILARKTSEYAQNLSPLLTTPATRPSLVEWAAPATRPADVSPQPAPTLAQFPLANQPATLAAAHLKEDTSMPLILPESADQIPSASPAPANPDAGNAAPAPNSPVTDSTDAYEQKLRKLVQDYPRDLSNQLDYQLLRLVRDEPTPDLSDVSQLSNEDRDLLLALMDGLNNFRAAARGNNIMLNSKIRPLIEMADRLRSQAQLSIPAVAFCRQVISYGVYTPMASTRFQVGRNNEMIVYNEAANFTSIQGSDSVWRTRLRQEMVLYTDTGLAVWPDKSNAAIFVDQARNRRHDFFISRRVMLPSSLAAGKYVLKITLTDEQSDRVVEASAPLELVGPSDTSGAQQASERTDPSSSLLNP